MEQQKVLNKVKMLLALAGNNPIAEEAQSAMMKAQALLAKAGLSMSDAELFDTKHTSQVVHEGATEYVDNTEWWVKALAGVLADNFRCVAYVNTTPSGKSQVRFMGMKDDVALCKDVFSFAVRAMEYNAEQYLKRRKQRSSWEQFSFTYLLSQLQGSERGTEGQRNDYITGFIRGLDEKFREQVERNNWGLVLVKNDIVLRAQEAMDLGSDNPEPKTSEGDYEAFERGRKDGLAWDKPKGEIEG